jgi:hypothetical protein
LSKHILSIAFLSAALLAGCGNGNNDQPVVGTYGYNGVAPGGHPMCSGRLIQEYENFLVPICSQASGPGSTCGQAIDQFRFENAQELRTPGCSIPTSRVHWCPGDNWRAQPSIDLNDAVLASWATRFGGPPSFPVNGGGFPNGGERFPR